MIAGIDCGSSGGIAWGDGNVTYAAKMPKSRKRLLDFFTENKITKVWIEKQQIRFTDLERKSVFRVVDGLIRNYHDCLFCCEVLDLPYDEVTPRAWQKIYNMPKDYQLKKQKAKKLAQEFFPEIKVTLAIADSLLILKHGIMIEGYEQIKKRMSGID